MRDLIPDGFNEDNNLISFLFFFTLLGRTWFVHFNIFDADDEFDATNECDYSSAIEDPFDVVKLAVDLWNYRTNCDC